METKTKFEKRAQCGIHGKELDRTCREAGCSTSQKHKCIQTVNQRLNAVLQPEVK